MVRKEFRGPARNNLQTVYRNHKKRSTNAPALAVLILHTIVALANAAILIPDRPALDPILGGSATTETFERFNLSNQPALFMPNCVDSSTILPPGFTDSIEDGTHLCRPKQLIIPVGQFSLTRTA